MNETIFAAVLFWSFGYLKLEIVWDLVLPPSPYRASAFARKLRQDRPSRHVGFGISFAGRERKAAGKGSVPEFRNR